MSTSDSMAAGTDLKPAPIDLSQRAEFDGNFSCPRCESPSTEEYYGPCQSCVVELRASQGGASRDVAAAAYEPKMNVTPNAVATKE